MAAKMDFDMFRKIPSKTRFRGVITFILAPFARYAIAPKFNWFRTNGHPRDLQHRKLFVYVIWTFANIGLSDKLSLNWNLQLALDMLTKGK